MLLCYLNVFLKNAELIKIIQLNINESEVNQSGSHAQIPYLQQCKVKSRNQGT
jgi:hypothetical protein